MAITVHEALELEILKGFKVIAGEKGLSNKITHVAVWDYEIGDLIAENFSPGDFALSTLVAIRDNIDELYGIVKRMIAVGISCLAIKNIYFNYIPEEVIKLADKENFPIMLFSDTFTEDVIVYVNKAISEKKKYENLTAIIDNILYNNLNELSIKEIARKVNINFKEKNIVAFCKKKNGKTIGIKSFSHKEMEEAFSKVIPYKDGYILINTFEEASQQNVDKNIMRRLEWWGFSPKEYYIGISSLYESLGNLNKAIQESLYAYKFSVTYSKDVSFFHDIGINRIILPILDNPWVLKYYSEMVEPLIVYDKENETELLKTAVKYVENNGDIKATALQLFQHGNTIRYRIDKINKILCKNSSYEHFYEELALAVRIYNLINNPL
ncbi:purine catabolism regulatory protein-like family protein [Clostridiales bacterium oral taxon 876 str. F0540]|nr:purine catabolism regulatory protein-like family protein [Clostridiales bacterium oral taxon 876 str. F0540]